MAPAQKSDGCVVELGGAEPSGISADQYRGWPPPVFIISVTVLELAFFIYYTAASAVVSAGGPTEPSGWPPPPPSLGAVPLDSVLLYRHDLRWQLWRHLTYMVLHVSWWHLLYNLLVQLLVGLPLEMVHGSGRVLAVYLGGVLTGSLATSVCRSGRQVYLVGASGGVYALLTAHVANVLLNHSQMQLPLARLAALLLAAGCDVAAALYRRAAPPPPPPAAVSYAAHLAGAAAGLWLGLLLLKQFPPTAKRPTAAAAATAAVVALALCTAAATLRHTSQTDDNNYL